MNFRISRENVPLMLISLFLALILWLQVQIQGQFTKESRFDVRVELRNLPDGFVVTRAPRTVKAVAVGMPENIDRMNVEDMVAFIDLGQAQVGSRSYVVQLNVPARIQVEVSLQRDLERVDVARVKAVDMPVAVEEFGVRPPDLKYDGATIDPPEVQISGPETAIANVGRVRVTLDLSRLRPGESFLSKVEVLGRNNQPLPMVTANPAEVRVSPGVAAAPVATNVPISLSWKGEPAFGFRVQNYELRPSQVRITGEPTTLAQVSTIETEPIDLTGIRESTNYTVTLRLPSGVRLARATSVRVLVRVVPVTAPNTLPPTP